MKTKLSGIVTEEDIVLVNSTIGQIQLPEAQKIDLIETVLTILYRSRKFYDRMTEKEKVEALTLLTLFADTMLSANPLAGRHFMKSVRCFNRNIFDVGGGAANA
jgi:ABC-type histidine transport system ATPase subunit